MSASEIDLRLMVRRLRRLARAQLAIFLLGILKGGNAIAFWIVRPALWYYAAGVILLVVLGVCAYFLAVRRYRADYQVQALFRFSVRPEKLDALLRGEGAVYSEADTVCFLTEERHMRIRELIQTAPAFDRAAVKKARERANRAVNRLLHETDRMEPGIKYMRINCVVCDFESDDMVRWVVSDFARLLTRNEIIVHAAVIRDRSELLLPVIQEPVYPYVLDLYQAAFLLLKRQLME